MIHVALKLRGDFFGHPMYIGFFVSKNKMTECVPESFFMFIRLIFGVPNMFENDPDEKECTLKKKQADTQKRV